MRPLAGIVLTAASVLVLTACIATPAPAPAPATSATPSTASSETSLDDLARELVDGGEVTFASIEEGAGHDDQQGLVIELAVADGIDGAAIAALVDDLQPGIDAVLGDERPERTYLALQVLSPEGTAGVVSLHGDLGRAAVAGSVDLLAVGACDYVDSFEEANGIVLHAACEGALTPGVAATTIDAITQHAFADPSFIGIRWGIFESVSTEVTLMDPEPEPGAVVDGILTSAAGLDVRLVRLSQDGAAMSMSGLITAPNDEVCASLWQQLEAAGATSGTVRMGLADGDGSISSDDERGCILTR